MSKKSIADSIYVKNECHEDWGAMKGGDKVRFCSHCSMNVNNISTFTRKEATRLVRKSDGRLCVRYVKDPATNAPIFASQFHQIARRTRAAAGVLSASLTLSALAFAQGNPDLTVRNLDLTVQNERKQVSKETADTQAVLSGFVTDDNGAAIPSVVMTLTNVATGSKQQTASNGEGRYEFLKADDGRHTLEAETSYFKKRTVELNLTSGSRNETNVALEVKSEVFVTMGIVAYAEYSTPLFRAASNDDIEAIKALIGEGESVNAKDKSYGDITPLFLAVENGNAETAELLLEFGAKINARDESRQTPLMRLDSDASAELVRTLFRYGAKAELKDRDGNNALILAARNVIPEAFAILLLETSDINARNANGRTALMEAADADNLENVRALLGAGADVNLKDKDGETAWDLTTSAEIDTLLKNYGAEDASN